MRKDQPKQKFRFAYGARCLADSCISNLPKQGRFRATVFAIDDKLSLDRTMVQFTMPSSGRKYFADVVTGSLYDPESLRCLSGDLRMAMK
jgi:hypothetical protein